MAIIYAHYSILLVRTLDTNANFKAIYLTSPQKSGCRGSAPAGARGVLALSLFPGAVGPQEKLSVDVRPIYIAFYRFYCISVSGVRLLTTLSTIEAEKSCYDCLILPMEVDQEPTRFLVNLHRQAELPLLVF